MKIEVGSIIILSLYVCILLVNISNSSPPFLQRAFYRRKIQACGSELSDTLSIICNGSYYSPPSAIQRKRFFYTYDDLSNPYWNLVVRQYGHPFRRISPFFSNREKKRGVVDECCHNRCTLQQIRAYCNQTEWVDHEERSLWMK
ncbi:insulin-like [Centruroides sculpturatus]|uniref:insulin-like n=1 Tax=Centruroides sculpturatus TaxID=218467 RepID=UPI000C6E4694|nr:insulin-like [Centruroides sculpturatus]XP_023238966.1 insulin-like [Centruroides sculpturatus]XP_023238967.1 insulin-like [Centruroides sculpturatus]XP_023238968.1 insulin-like [Centruroides sculpturatus]